MSESVRLQRRSDGPDPLPARREPDALALPEAGLQAPKEQGRTTHTEAPPSISTPPAALHFGEISVHADGAGNGSIQRGASGDGQSARTEREPTAEIGPAGGPVSPHLAERIGARLGAGAPLDPSTRADMESAFGTSFGDVRVHTDDEAHGLNRRVGSVAFTTGSDVFFRSGTYGPDSGAGRALLMHELTHVVQQRSMAGDGPMTVAPAGDPLEQEAEARGSVAASVQRAIALPALTPSASLAPVGRRIARLIQRAIAPVELNLERASARSPYADPRLRGVLDEVGQAAHAARIHPPAQHAVTVAQQAAPTPVNDTTSRAQVVQVQTMKAAPVAKPETNAFLALLRQKLAEIAPKNNQEMKEFAKSGKTGQVKDALTGQARAQGEKAQEPLAQATSAPPPTGSVTPREAGTPPDAPAPAALPGVNAPNAVPPPAPDPAPAVAQAVQTADQRMVDAKITDQQLQKANDPRFSAAADAQGAMHTQAASSPQQFDAKQQAVLTKTAADVHGKAAAAHAHMQQAHASAHGAAHGEQQAVMSREAQARKAVADTIERMFNETKTKVDAKLKELGPAVDQLFTEGEKAARESFDAEVDRRTTEYWLEHPLDAVSGWATGNDPELEKIWHQERDNYTRALDNVLVRIADRVEQVLKDAKDLIAAGHAEIEKYVAGLDPQLRASGQQAEEAIGKHFDELQRSVDNKREELASHLVDRYQAAQQAMDDHLKELEDSNKGLINGFLEKLEEVAKAIEEFKTRLKGVVTNAEETLDLIIQDPIAFLGHLLDALKQGFTQFLGNILNHLKRGLMEWLFGTLASAGIQLPQELDLKGIIMLVLQILGITWDKIRAKIVKIIGPRAMRIIEKIVEYVSVLIKGGIEGLWEHIKEDLGGLKDMVMNAIRDWIITTIVQQAIQKLVTMSNPVGAIVEAVIDIYKVVMFFIEKAQQIMNLVETIVRSVSSIAHGVIGEAANWVEQSMANTIPVIIGFLADLIGLGGLATKIQELIKKAQEVVDKAIDAALAKIVEVAKGLFGGGKEDEKEAPQGPDSRTDDQKKADLGQAMSEADALFTQKGVPADRIKEQLVPIKSKYRLNSLDLVTESGSGAENKAVVHVEGSMSPPVAGPPHTVAAKAAELVEVQCNLGLKDGALDMKGRLADISRSDLEALQQEFGVGTEANLTNVQLRGFVLEYQVDVVLGDPVPREGAEGAFALGSQVGLLEPVQDKEGKVKNQAWQRAHVIGPGFGIELPMILYAPHKVNQDLQNRGIEKLLRELAAKVGDFADIHVTAVVKSQPGSLRLGEITYKVSGQQEGQAMKDLLEVTITVEGTAQKPRVSSRADFVSGALEGVLGQTWESFVASQDPDVEKAVREENKKMRSALKEEVRKARGRQ